MKLFSRLRASSRIAEEETPPPSPSQVAPPSLHHHLQRPTRLLRSEKLELHDLLAAQPARVGMSPSDSNGLRTMTKLALKWKNRPKEEASTLANAARSDLLSSQRSLAIPTARPSTVSRVKTRSLSGASRMLTETVRSGTTGSTRGGFRVASTPRDETSSPLRNRKTSDPQASGTRLLRVGAGNRQCSLDYPLGHPPADTRVGVNFWFHSSNSENDSPHNHQPSYASSTLDLLQFYQEVHGYNRKF